MDITESSDKETPRREFRPNGLPVPLLGPHELTADEQQEFMLGIFNLGYGTASGEQTRPAGLCTVRGNDPDIFFPEKGGSTTPATSVCSQCMVQAECPSTPFLTTFATAFGGGMSDNDRRRLSRERRRVRNGCLRFGVCGYPYP